MIGSRYCPTYTNLHRKSDFEGQHPEAAKYGRDELLRWDGRVSLTKIIEDCRAIGVTFD